MYGFMKAWLANIVRDTRKIESKENNKKTTSRSDTDSSIHIPLDLILEIFSRLPVKSLARFQCLSKQWSSLITDSIMNWSLAKPRQLVIFHPSYMGDQLLSLFSYPLNMDHETSISARAELEGYIFNGLDINFLSPYIRGLILCMLRSNGGLAIYNTTTRQCISLPAEIKWKKPVRILDGLFGYDPVENQYKVLRIIRYTGTQSLENIYQLFTLGDPKMQWRNIQGFGLYFSPTLMATKVCINGKVYFIASVGRYGYIANPDVLLSFDFRSERFNLFQLPNQSPNLTLVNYQGKLGCIDYNDDSADMWIMEKQEWSKINFSMPHPLLKSLASCTRIAGVTLNGEVVIMPKKMEIDQTLYAFYYDPKQNKTRRVEFDTPFLKQLASKKEVHIIGVPDHVDNIMSFVGFSPKLVNLFSVNYYNNTRFRFIG